MDDEFPAIEIFGKISYSFYYLKNIHFTLDMNHLLELAHLVRRQHFQGKILGGGFVQTQHHAGKSTWERVATIIH